MEKLCKFNYRRNLGLSLRLFIPLILNKANEANEDKARHTDALNRSITRCKAVTLISCVRQYISSSLSI